MGLEELPTDLWGEVAAFLTPSAAASLSRVSTRLREEMRAERVWEALLRSRGKGAGWTHRGGVGVARSLPDCEARTGLPLGLSAEAFAAAALACAAALSALACAAATWTGRAALVTASAVCAAAAAAAAVFVTPSAPHGRGRRAPEARTARATVQGHAAARRAWARADLEEWRLEGAVPGRVVAADARRVVLLAGLRGTGVPLVRVYGARSGRLLYSVPCEGTPTGACVTGTWLVVAYADRTGLRCWDLSRRASVFYGRRVLPVERHVAAVVPLGDGAVLVASSGGRVNALRAADGERLWSGVAPGLVSCLAAGGPRGLVAAGLHARGTFCVFRAAAGGRPTLVVRDAHSGRVGSVAVGRLHGGAEAVLTASPADPCVRMWDPTSGDLLRTFELGLPGGVRSLVWRGERALAVGSDGAELRFWEPSAEAGDAGAPAWVRGWRMHDVYLADGAVHLDAEGGVVVAHSRGVSLFCADGGKAGTAAEAEEEEALPTAGSSHGFVWRRVRPGWRLGGALFGAAKPLPRDETWVRARIVT